VVVVVVVVAAVGPVRGGGVGLPCLPLVFSFQLCGFQILRTYYASMCTCEGVQPVSIVISLTVIFLVLLLLLYHSYPCYYRYHR
jgi:hypothetical protein